MAQHEGLTLPVLLTVRAAAEAIGCHEDTIRRGYLCGQLQARRIGRTVRIEPASLEDWIKRGGLTRAA